MISEWLSKAWHLLASRVHPMCCDKGGGCDDKGAALGDRGGDGAVLDLDFLGN